MKVILAQHERDAELLAYDEGLPPRSRDVILISTDKQSGLSRLRGLMLKRDDVLEHPSAIRGRFYADYRRQLEPTFY